MKKLDYKVFLRNLTNRPGVYRMLDAKREVIYVGKAINLKNRVASYFGRSQDSPKTKALVKQIAAIEVTVTQSESEALLLENNLIKELRPRYNILFRDDKSYPYLYLSSDQEYPRLSYYRGARKGKGRYFGPYPSAHSAKKILNLSQKLFQIHQCDDKFFRNRSRPCLQYQIKRCTAPCVGYIDRDVYAKDVEHAALFLDGKNEKVIEILAEPMQQAADALDYERAAKLRDQISDLRKAQERQYISGKRGEIDIIACSIQGGIACVQIFFIRGSQILGNKAFYPTHTKDAIHADILSAFLTQFYMTKGTDRISPSEILLSHEPNELSLIENGLSEKASRKVKLKYRIRGDRLKLMEMALDNARISLLQRLSEKQNIKLRMEALQEILSTEDGVERIECFDISHTQGEATVASCVVFGTEGAKRSDYRRFNIKDIQPGNDCNAMRQVIERRYTRVQREEGRLPDLILIDGGVGQVNAAKQIMRELQLDDIMILGVTKGPTRKAGMETLIFANTNQELTLPANSSALHLIQEVRDEAHRFAISGHRQRRKKNRMQSPLDSIEGVGAKRRQQLIRHFGGWQGVARAGVEDIARVPGINKNLANKIYNSLHGS